MTLANGQTETIWSADTGRIAVIGTSLGGFRAVQEILVVLPVSLTVPIVLVQHRGAGEDELLVETLDRVCALQVVEPDDKAAIETGKVFVAPSGYHLMVEGDHFALSTAEPERHARPSIDALFETAADSFRERTIGVLLTGATADGANGLYRIQALGGTVIVQDPATAAASAMPRAGLARTRNGKVMSIDEIGAFIRGV